MLNHLVANQFGSQTKTMDGMQKDNFGFGRVEFNANDGCKDIDGKQSGGRAEKDQSGNRIE